MSIKNRVKSALTKSQKNLVTYVRLDDGLSKKIDKIVEDVGNDNRSEVIRVLANEAASLYFESQVDGGLSDEVIRDFTALREKHSLSNYDIVALIVRSTAERLQKTG